MGFEKLDKFLRRSFRKYGTLVGQKPMPFLLVPLMISFVLTFGFIWFRTETDLIKMFTKPSALSRREVTILRQFSRTGPSLLKSPAGSENDHIDATAPSEPAHTDYQIFDIYVISQDDRNLMTKEMFDSLVLVLKHVYANFTCLVKLANNNSFTTLKYSPDFCKLDGTCLRMDRNLEILSEFLSKDYQRDKRVNITYPALKVFGREIIWADIVRGVTLDENNIVTGIKMLLLPLQFQVDRRKFDLKTVHQCMYQLAKYFWNIKPVDPNGVTFHASYEQLFVDEVRKTQNYILPYLGLSAVLVTLFCTLSMLEKGHGKASAIESGFGMFTIALSIVSTLGLLFVLGQSYNFIVACMPFVVLCASVDNDFLLLAALRSTDPRRSVHIRLGEAMADAGPSVTITSLTDVLCFAIGVVSAVPAVSNFCLFTAVALTIRYFYQLSFYIAILAFGAENRLCNFGCMKPKPGSEGTSSTMLKTEHLMHRFFRVSWTNFLMYRLTKILALLIYIGYLMTSLIFAMRLKINVTPARIVVEDSKLVPVFKTTERFRSTSAIIGHAIVLKPPDFRNSSNRQTIIDFIDRLKQSKYYSNSTSVASIWFNAYMNYFEFVDEVELFQDDPEYATNFYVDLSSFLKTSQALKYVSDIHFNETLAGLNATEPNIESFQFKFYFRDVNSWESHIELMLHWRQVCSNFPNLDAMVIDRNNLNPYLDEMTTIGPTTLQTMGIALIAIIAATGLMMPDAVGIFYIALSFISVDIGVIGFLNMWNCDLDMATTTGILITIGFSVYYTARICYSYQTCCRDGSMTSREKLAYTLGAVGWPVLQGGIGTALGIMPLVFVKSYITLAFFKTITLVVLFGLYHGLVFMPVMMTCLDSKGSRLLSRKVTPRC